MGNQPVKHCFQIHGENYLVTLNELPNDKKQIILQRFSKYDYNLVATAVYSLKDLVKIFKVLKRFSLKERGKITKNYAINGTIYELFIYDFVHDVTDPKVAEEQKISVRIRVKKYYHNHKNAEFQIVRFQKRFNFWYPSSPFTIFCNEINALSDAISSIDHK